MSKKELSSGTQKAENLTRKNTTKKTTAKKNVTKSASSTGAKKTTRSNVSKTNNTNNNVKTSGKSKAKSDKKVAKQKAISAKKAAREQKKIQAMKIRAEKKQRRLEKKLEAKQKRLDRIEASKQARAERKEKRRERRDMLKHESKEARIERKQEERRARVEAHVAKREAALAEKRAKREHRLKVRAEKRAAKNDKRHAPGFGGWLAAVISLGVTTLALGTMLTFGWLNMNGMEAQMSTMHTESVYELNSIVDNLDTNLAKARISNSQNEQVKLLSQIAIESEMAEVILERLPFETQLTEYLTSFVNKMGDRVCSIRLPAAKRLPTARSLLSSICIEQISNSKR